MDATVIVCTYNRAESLRDTLRVLRALKASPARTWEVIVVDNNSSDHTRAVVEEAQRKWSLLRYEFESEQGLSYARNRGISCAVGGIILFTDDDVLPEPEWLETTLAGLERFAADACGGYIAPIWEVPPPTWLTERFYGFVAVRTDRTDSFLMNSQDPTPFGANMAFRRAVFDEVGLFDTTRGRKGAVLASGEDGEMFERIHHAGLRVAFRGNSRVHHKVEAFRCTKKYLRRWRTQSSRNIAISRGVSGQRRVANIPLYLFPQFLRALWRAVAGKLTRLPDEAFHREMIVCHFVGTMQGLLSVRRTRANADQRR